MSLDNILLIPGLDWTPRNLFRPGDNGLWQDMSNFGTLRQLSTGSTLVSSVGDPIGYIADSGPRGHLTTQTTNGKRPILSRSPEGGVRQLLQYSDLIIGASSGTPGTGPTGWTASTVVGNPVLIVTAEGLRIQAVATERRSFFQSFSVNANTTYAFTVICDVGAVTNIHQCFEASLLPAGTTVTKFQDGNPLTTFQNVSVGTNTELKLIVAVGATAGTIRLNFGAGISAPEVSNPDITFKQIQFEVGSTRTNYQKSTTLYNITEAGKRDCWAYGTDGIDDAMSTPSSVDMSGSNEMTVCVGLRKFSDASTGIVCELSAIASNPGTFVSSAPSSVGANSYRFSSTGTSSASAGTGVFAAAPDSAVILGESKISTDVCKISRNGTLVESVSDDQGTGNYGNYRIYFGARAETSLFFQGLVYQAVIINRLLSDYEKTKLQQFVARKMGITL